MRIFFEVMYWGAWFIGGVLAISFLALVAAFVAVNRYDRRKGFIPTNPQPPSHWRGHRARPPHPGIW